MSDPISWKPAFDFADAGFRADPYPVYRHLRDAAPVAYHEPLDAWLVSRHEDVHRTLRDERRFSNGSGSRADPVVAVVGAGDLLNLDPPRHDVLRRLVRAPFAPRAVAELEHALRAQVERLVAPLANAGAGDLAADVAWPLSVWTILRLLGSPEADVPRVTALVRALDQPGGVAVDELQRLRRYVEEALETTDEGLVADVVAASAAGELRREEGAGLVMGLLLAGTATVACLIANGALVLLRHPEQRRRLRDGSVTAATAVEELLRFESPVQVLPRRTTVPVTLGGSTIPADATVLLLLGSANRDERRFERADALDLGRRAPGTVALGGGIHFCLGAALARLEGRIAFERLFRHLGPLELAGEPERLPSADVRGLLRLPVRMTGSG